MVVSRVLPDPAGAASARLLHGFMEGLVQLGRPAELWSWWPGQPPSRELPSYVRWQPLPAESWVRMKARALVRPRSDVLAAGYSLPPDVIAVAEEPLSFAAVRHHPRSVATIHYATALDVMALGAGEMGSTELGAGGRGALQWSARAGRRWQDERAERAAATRARAATAYSPRVGQAFGHRVQAVPCAIEMPNRLLPLVDEPVATCVADWSWPPNRLALDWLLAAWPKVRAALPSARLLLAGYGEAAIGTLPGVSVLGPVADSTAVLERSAVLAFPCPPTSGPKVKVLEAASLGLPVVTTAAGAEGLELGSGAYAEVKGAPGDVEALANALLGVLRDPARRAGLASTARAAVEAGHAPAVAAGRRVAVIDAALAGRRAPRAGDQG